MKKLFFILNMFAVPVMLLGQRNVVPAAQTQLLGIYLPEGSKQDKRMLSVAAAGSFLSMSTEYKNLEFSPVEVYSIPVASGFNIESVRTNLTENGYNVKFDKGDNKLRWVSSNNSNWLLYLSQETNEINIYIGKSTISQIVSGNTSPPVIAAVAQPEQTNNGKSAGKHPAFIPPLAGRQTITTPQKTEENESQMVVYDLDSNRYEVIKIGEQYWMKENLRTTKYNDTTRIITGLGAQEWSKVRYGAYSVYDDNSINRMKYGLLYNGYAVATGKLCPTGWHVSTDEEWGEIEKFFGISDSELARTGERGEIAQKLKTVADWEPSSFSGNNSSGFSILPAGARLDNGEYTTKNQYTNFWTSTIYDDRYGLLYLWNHHLYYNSKGVGRIYTIANNGYSCRCVKDKPKPVKTK